MAKPSDGLVVVPVKNAPMSWGYVIVNPAGKVVARGHQGSMGGPLIRKGAAKTAGEDHLKRIRKADRRIAKAIKRGR